MNPDLPENLIVTNKQKENLELDENIQKQDKCVDTFEKQEDNFKGRKDQALKAVEDEFSKIKKEKQSEKVKEMIVEEIELLAENENIEVRDIDLPEVKVRDSKSSCYDPTENTIFIEENAINNGIDHFEEISHFLRCLVQQRKGISPEKQDVHVQEFFGRIGETLGRELVKGTDLESLFKDIQPREVKSSETDQLIDNLIDRSKKIKGLQKELAISNDIIIKMQKENANSVTRMLEKSLEEEELNIDNLLLEFRKMASDHIASIKNSQIKNAHVDDVKQYLSHLDYLNGSLSLLREYEAPAKQKKEYIQGNLNTFKEMNSLLFERQFTMGDLELFTLSFNNDNLKRSVYEHLDPYAYAQQYSFEQLSKKNLYSMSDRDIKKKYFRKINNNKNFISGFLDNLKDKLFRRYRNYKIKP